MLESLTDRQRDLLALGAGLIPGLLGLAIPGGLVRDSVNLDFGDILLATLPWTASTACVAWLVLRREATDLALVAQAAAILTVGALLAPLFGPSYQVAEDQASQAAYYWVAQSPDATVSNAAGSAAHNPRAAAGAVLGGIIIAVAFLYWVLYGGALWVAGIACGLYLGWRLNQAFPVETHGPPPDGPTAGPGEKPSSPSRCSASAASVHRYQDGERPTEAAVGSAFGPARRTRSAVSSASSTS